MSSIPSVRPSSAAFLKSGRILHRFIILMLLGSGLASQPVSGQTGASTLETQMISYDNEQVFTAIARFPSNRAWALERGLFLSPQPGGSGAWIPIATGYGSFLPPTYSSFLSDAYDQIPRHGFTASLQSFPLVPVELLPSSLGLGPRPQYLFVHAAMRFRPSDGTVTAHWENAADPGGAGIDAVFTIAELDLRDPTPDGRYPFAAGCLTGLPSDTTPIYLSFSIFPLVGNEPVTQATSNLSPANLAIRNFIIQHGPELSADMWPLISTSLPPPPTPVTLAQRSFYRLRTGSQLPADGNTNGIPDSIEAYFNYPNQPDPFLIISEACFFRTAATAADLIGGEAADWVEIWNPTSNPLSTADYFLSNTSSEKEKFPLPIATLDSGEYLIIHCTKDGKARLPLSDPLYPVTAGFDLKESGDKLYLNRRRPVGGVPTTSNVHTLDPPPGSVFPSRAIANISFGIQASGSGGFDYGYFEHPTPAASNLSQMLPHAPGASVACAEPTIEDGSKPLPEPLNGQVFHTGTFTARLRSPDAAATIVYTLNGTEPTGQSAVYDPAQPIVIGGTTILRARALKQGLLPSSTITRTFIHTPSVLSQINPTTLNEPLNDPKVSTAYQASAPALAGYSAAGGIVAQLESRPSIFITDPSKAPQTIPPTYHAITTTGTLVSVEYCDPAHPDAYCQENAYLRLSGNHSNGDSVSKDSWHLLFKKSVNLKGNNRWQTPVIAAPAPLAGTSAIFPGSPVRDLNRLILRNPGSDSYFDILGGRSSNSVYIRDSWMKETQRSLGGFTARRRWVHVHRNGLYWGVYDLEEHHNSDTISDHLIAANPGLTDTQKKDYAPEKILFLNYGSEPAPPGESGYYAEPVAQASWEAVIAAASAARQAPGNAGLYQAVALQLNIPAYIDYMLTHALVGKGDLKAAQFRGWRHPITQQWHLIAWDGDDLDFSDDVLGVIYLNNTDKVNHFTPLPPGTAPAYVLPDFHPHEHLKFHPTYRSAFDVRLREMLKSSSANPAVAVPLSQQGILDRFDLHAQDFRKSLECEVMRWGGAETPDELPAAWANQMNAIRFELDPQNEPVANLLRTRHKLKDNARDSRLLNDIPPPVITVSGNNIVITQPGPSGRIYYEVSYQERDPKSYEISPVATPASTYEDDTFTSGQTTITARVYRPDLDGENAWSAKSVFTRP